MFPHLSWHDVAADFGNRTTPSPWDFLALLHFYVGASFPWYFFALLSRHVLAILPGSGLGQGCVTLEPVDKPLSAPGSIAASPLARTFP